MTTQTTRKAPPAARPAGTRATPGQNLTTIVLGWWLMIGIFIDGWAHNRFGESLETFFTPWHAVFYSGFAAVAGWVLYLAWRGWQAGRRSLAAFPAGYNLAALGVPVFFLGGLGDLTWHTIFGIEVGLDALLSPTHLLLFLGAELIVLSPLAAAWAEPVGRRAPGLIVWPAVLSTIAGLCFASFMHMYSWALLSAPTALGWSQSRAALAVTLLTALMLAAPVLLLLRRFHLPFGAVTAIYGVNTLLMVVMASTIQDGWRQVLLMLLAGLLADTLIQALSPAPGRPYAYRAFALALPLLVWVPYFVGAQAMGLNNLSLELWAGVSVMAALGGLALSALIVPPALPKEAEG